MRQFYALARKELLVLGKDLHGLLVLFVMPAVFILIMSLAMRDAFNEGAGAVLEFLYVDHSEHALARDLKGRLEQMPGFAMVEGDQGLSPAALRALVTEDRYRFAVVVPPDFDRRVEAWNEGRDQREPLLAILMSPTVAPQTRLLFQTALDGLLNQLQLEALLFQGLEGGGGAWVNPAAMTAGEFVYRDGQANETPTAVQQSVPAWLVFSMFFVVIPLSTAFLVERQQGSLVRLQMMNVSPLALLTAKVVPYYAVNQVQMVLMVLVGMYLVPLLGGDALNRGDSLGGLLLISSAASIAAIGFALLISTLVRSGTEATTLGGVMNIIFGALGGVMVPKFVMPDFMQELSVISPMSWGLEGFLDIFLRRGGWRDVIPEATALVLFGVVCLVLASLSFRRLTRT